MIEMCVGCVRFRATNQHGEWQPWQQVKGLTAEQRRQRVFIICPVCYRNRVKHQNEVGHEAPQHQETVKAQEAAV